MKGFKIAATLLVLVVLFAIALLFLTQRIYPSTIGVKQVVWGPGKGFYMDDYGAGLHLGVAGYHRWHLLPRRTHFLHFTTSQGVRRGARGALEIEDWQPPLEIRTKDNNTVKIDVTVTYRIAEGEAHRIVVDGLKAEYRHRVRSQVLGVLRSELSELTSEDLQSTEKRLGRAKATTEVLTIELARFHVVPEDLLIRRVEFTPEYENKLQEKQLLHQQATLDQALTGQANEERQVKVIERQIGAAELKLTQEWEKTMQEKRSDYQVMIAEIGAQAAVYSAQTRAEGEAEREIAIARGKLALEQSQALRDELRNQALNSEGGRILLALDAVKNLNIPRVTLNSDDPAVPMLLDLDQMTRLLVGPEQ